MRIVSAATVLLFCCSVVPAASGWAITENDPWCQRSHGDERYCEVRETTLPATRDVIAVDGQLNGGIQVEGWDRNEIQLRARLVLWNEDGTDEGLDGSRIEIRTDGKAIRAEGPALDKHAGWSVSFRLMVPRDSNLDLETTNGGIHLSNLDGQLRFQALNGGVHLSEVAGDVQGRTTNGGLDVELDGSSWLGEILDVETVNGGIELTLPEYFSAHLITRTVNGQIRSEIPLDFDGEKQKRVDTTIGSGGPTVRVVTTNGGVVIRER